MGIMVYSLLWVVQDLYHQPYVADFELPTIKYMPKKLSILGVLAKAKATAKAKANRARSPSTETKARASSTTSRRAICRPTSSP